MPGAPSSVLAPSSKAAVFQNGGDVHKLFSFERFDDVYHHDTWITQ